MLATMLLASFLSSQTAAVQVPAFQPKLNVRIRPAAARPHPAGAEIVCGMPMVRISPDLDRGILRSRSGNPPEAPEPAACGAQRLIPAK